MDPFNILPLLGLALRGRHVTVGEEPVEAVTRARDARLLVLASDAADGTRRRCEHFAAAGDCLWVRLPFSKEELGRSLGRSSVAIAAVTDVGLAAALLRRLAQLDPEQYQAASSRMDLKARRASERRAEQQARSKMPRQKRKAEPPSPPARADSSGKRTAPLSGADRSRSASRRPKGSRSPAQAHPYANSRPVKKGKGSFRKKKESS